MKRFLSTVALAVAVLIAAAGMTWAQAKTTIQVMQASGGVSYLTDSKGMTLYYYTKDTNGQSACYGGCATAWPIFYSETVSVPAGLKASDFGTITRTDNTKQTTYMGWPLYYWQKDAKAGEMTGEGVGKVWYILKVPAYTVMISTSADKAIGNYLVDGLGRSLYWFTKDSVDTSACSGDCIKNWPAFSASSLVVPSALNAADFSSITRADGTKQTTFKGYPLYYWVKDTMRGDTTGQDVGKVWYVIDPAKFPPAKM
jgi:predicted lipoprotein with Yx(FWY)xxD motif